MTDYRTDHTATILRRLHTLPLPAGTMAWLVSPDGDMVGGPHPAVALAWYADDIRYQAHVFGLDYQPDAPAYYQFRAGDPLDEAVDHRTEQTFEFTQPHVLVLFPGYGQSDDPWLEGEYVFFTKEAALEAVVVRRERAEQERKEKAIKELTQPK